MLMVLIEDIAAVHRLDEIIKVDHLDVFFVAPSDLATSMGHIGNTAHPEVQKPIDAALTKIVQAGRGAGPPVNAGTVGRYPKVGVRGAMAPCFPFTRAAAQARMSRT